jgi:hypothetical protein
MTISIESESGVIRTLGNPIKFGPVDIEPTPPPRLGEHTDMLLSRSPSGGPDEH